MLLLRALAFALAAASVAQGVLLKAPGVEGVCARERWRCTVVTETAAYVDGVPLDDVLRAVPGARASADATQSSTSPVLHPFESVRGVPEADLAFDFLGVYRPVPVADAPVAPGPAPTLNLSATAALPTAPGLLQTNAPYQLAFLNARQRTRCETLGADCRFADGAFLYSHTGAGVRVYVVGGAIRAGHFDFARSDGSVRVSADTFREGARNGSGCEFWAGTHAASLAAGGVYGVAKDAEIVQVVVKPGCRLPAPARPMLEGLAWVKRHAADRRSVVLVIAEVAAKDALVAEVVDDAARELVAAGHVLVTGAGLNAGDACAYSPGRVPDVLTVGAARVLQLPGKVVAVPADDSNGGRCVDLWAPGWWLEGAFGADVDTTAVLSGSGQAAAMTAGAAAVLLQRFPRDPPAAIAERLLNAASSGFLVFPLPDTSDLVLQSPVA